MTFRSLKVLFLGGVGGNAGENYGVIYFYSKLLYLPQFNDYISYYLASSFAFYLFSSFKWRVAILALILSVVVGSLSTVGYEIFMKLHFSITMQLNINHYSI